MRHIHEILDLIFQSDKTFHLDSFESEIKRLFGEDCTFTSCADNEMSTAEVTNFLLQRGKIKIEEGKIIPLSQGC